MRICGAHLRISSGTAMPGACARRRGSSMADARSWQRFLWLWAAEMLSITGTGLTAFALGAWVYAETGRATDFALLSVAATLPGILLLPLGGVLADVLPRKAVMTWCNGVAGVCAAWLAWLVYSDSLTLIAIYLLLAISALCRALQWVTFTATMTQMVPAHHLGRSSAMIYAGEAGQHLLAPALAALALPFIGYAGVIGLDLTTFLFAVIVIAAVPIPATPPGDWRRAGEVLSSLRAVVSEGWGFIRERPGLLYLQIFFALSQFLGGFLPILTLPALVELTGSEQVTGLTMAAAGTGLVLGMVWLVARPRMSGRVWATVFCDMAASAALLALAFGATRFGAPWFAAAGCAFLFFHALESGISQDLWQRKVPGRLQGRVFAIRRTIAWSLVPLCYVLAGPLVDDWLAPAMAEGAPLGQIFGPLLGYESLGAMLLLMGAAAALRLFGLAPAALLTRRLMRIEEELVDYV
ncbi:MFS transporter [Lujinxingia vulgaris]|uniref:MFS transporter n=2 Tax=Lujinxingia vulgaris TaxID=2600176 RepID=A0A5C6X3G4_9DELT|nr:MFS transporter [Lujinxingia vulgaris]